MTEEYMESIVTEVLRRLQVNSGKKHALILMAGEPTDSICDFAMDLMRRDYTFTHVVCKEQENVSLPIVSRIFLYANDFLERVSGLVNEQDILLLSGLSLSHLAQVRDLRPSCGITTLLCEALRCGKRVCIWTTALTPCQSTPLYAQKLIDMRSELENMGIEFCGKMPTISQPLQLMQQVISKQDLQQIEGGSVLVNRDTVFTTTAKELLSKRNITVIRR